MCDTLLFLETSATHFILVPTYNERNNIRVLVEKLFSLYPTIHVLVIDDSSPDGTADVVKEHQSAYPNLHLKQRSGKLGLASAYLGAFKDILRDYPDVQTITTMDADLSHDPSVIGTLHEEMRTHDLVLGSRYISGGSIGNWGLWRRFLSIGGNLYTRMVTRSRVRDLTGGFNCYSAQLLKRYDLDAIQAEGYGYQMEMKITAEHLGARIKEVPITFSDRTDGESKISNHIIYEGLIVPWRFSPLRAIFKDRCYSRSATRSM